MFLIHVIPLTRHKSNSVFIFILLYLNYYTPFYKAKMLNKLLALAIVLSVIAAEPAQQKTFSTNNDIVYTEYPGSVVVPQPDASAVIDVIGSLIGYKTSALTIAVAVIEWFVSNFFVILIGAATALGFCKITGKCTLNYEEYIPVSQLQGLVTPENIQTAEKFLYTAVEKYAEKKKRST